MARWRTGQETEKRERERGRRKRQGQECHFTAVLSPQPAITGPGVLWPNFTEPECFLAKYSKVDVRQQRTITLDVQQTILPNVYDSRSLFIYCSAKALEGKIYVELFFLTWVTANSLPRCGWDKSFVYGSLIFDRKTNNDSNGIYYKIIWHT